MSQLPLYTSLLLIGRLIRFACDITESWCARNNIELVIRSHEYNPSGFLVMHNGRLITVFSARNYMDAVFNDSALLLLTYDDTKSLRVRIKTFSKKYIPPVASEASPGEMLMAANHSSDEAICEQFGKIRLHSNLLDAILVPETPRDLTIIEGVVESREEGGDEESEIDSTSIQIDYSASIVLCSSQTNLNDILRETNQKYDKKLLKRESSKKKKKKSRKKSSFDSEEESEEDEGEGERVNGYMTRKSFDNDDEKGEESEENLSVVYEQKSKTTFVKRLRNSVKEIFSRSSSKEISTK